VTPLIVRYVGPDKVTDRLHVQAVPAQCGAVTIERTDGAGVVKPAGRRARVASGGRHRPGMPSRREFISPLGR